MKMAVRMLCFLLAVTLAMCHGSQILLITMGGTKSHKIPFLELASGLIKRGHNITFINAFPPDKAIPQLEEITPPGLVFFVRNFTNWDLLGSRIRNEEPVTIGETIGYAYQACDALMSDPETHSLLKSGRKFDLIVMDGAYPECAFGLAHHYKAPYMYINTVGFYTGTISMSGSPAPYSVTPFFAKPLTDNMNLFERAQNAAYHMLVSGLHRLVNVFVHDILTRHWPDMPPIMEMAKNVSFILQNSNAAVTYPRAYLPNVAEVGCIHCKPAKSLPKEIEEFINDGGDQGFIYVSMGSSVKTRNMPEYLRLLFVNVFSQLPYKVLWKWEAGNGSMSDVPSNVYLGRWLPQQDVLGHRKIRAFVTHGGLLSIFETVYHAVPVVTMPVFCDQDSNAMKAEVDGYAVKMELSQITADRLLRAINKVVHDPRYRDNVEKRSNLLRDQASTPLQQGIYWVEYVIRHKGAFHLQSPARNLNFFQYFSIDLFLIALTALILTTLATRKAIKVFRTTDKLKQKTKSVKQH